jgi:hypothetical protein
MQAAASQVISRRILVRLPSCRSGCRPLEKHALSGDF